MIPWLNHRILKLNNNMLQKFSVKMISNIYSRHLFTFIPARSKTFAMTLVWKTVVNVAIISLSELPKVTKAVIHPREFIKKYSISKQEKFLKIVKHISIFFTTYYNYIFYKVYFLIRSRVLFDV